MWRIIFNKFIQSRDSYRLDPTSIQEQEFAVCRTLPVLESDNVFAHCLKWYFSISFSAKMVGLFDFLFVLPNICDAWLSQINILESE